MTAAARSYVFGMSPSAVRIAACWAGYTDPGIDAPPDELDDRGPNPFHTVHDRRDQSS